MSNSYLPDNEPTDINIVTPVKEKKSKDYNEHFKCAICGGKYSLINRSHHYNTKKHKEALNAKELTRVKSELFDLKENLKKLTK